VTRVLLGLGSNMGDRRGRLRDAVASLGRAVITVSDVYETEPVGGPDQEPFLNVVVRLDTDLEPTGLLDLCHQLEDAAGRTRDVRWGPRTLDVDILWIDGVGVDQPDLVVPHPRMRERRFVMAPLADVAPDLAGVDWNDHAEGQVTRLGPLG